MRLLSGGRERGDGGAYRTKLYGSGMQHRRGHTHWRTAGASAAAWPLILILVITSVAGLFYYLRIVVALYSVPAEHTLTQRVSRSGTLVAVGLSIFLVWFGIYSTPLLNLVRATMVGRDGQNLLLVTKLKR